MSCDGLRLATAWRRAGYAMESVDRALQIECIVAAVRGTLRSVWYSIQQYPVLKICGTFSMDLEVNLARFGTYSRNIRI